MGFLETSAVLSQLPGKLPNLIYAYEDNLKYIKLVLDNLKNIFLLNPISSGMRDYVRMTDTELKTNCEKNVSFIDTSIIMNLLCHICVIKRMK